MSLIINKINKGNKGGVFLRFIRVVFLLIIIFGPIAAASLFDLSACERASRWYWIAAFSVLFFISFEIMGSRHDKKGKHILTFSFLIDYLAQPEHAARGASKRLRRRFADGAVLPLREEFVLEEFNQEEDDGQACGESDGA